jgi:hypothetical protein
MTTFVAVQHVNGLKMAESAGRTSQQPSCQGGGLCKAIGVEKGDLLCEVIAFAEYFTDDPDNIIGMTVVFGINQRLRDLGTTGEKPREKFLLERLDHRPNLIIGDN